MKKPDWEEAYHKLLAETRSVISKFSQEHPAVEVSDFWYDSEPRYGYVIISINTLESAQRSARKRYDYHVNYRRKLLTEDLDTWLDNAVYQLECHSVQETVYSTGDFEFVEYAQIDFPDWKDCAECDDYPEAPDWEGDYLECRVAYLFWRSFETLVAENAFSSFRLASPTRLGFAFHDSSENIMHLLNWKNSGTEQDIVPNP